MGGFERELGGSSLVHDTLGGGGASNVPRFATCGAEGWIEMRDWGDRDDAGGAR